MNVVKAVKAIRNNWKKSLAVVAVGTLGYTFARKKYRSIIVLLSSV